MNINGDTDINDPNFPQQFIEIAGLFQQHKKKIKKVMLKNIHQYFTIDNDKQVDEIIEVLDYAVLLNENYCCSFLINLLCNIYGVKQKSAYALCCILEMINTYFHMQLSIPDIENNDYKNKKLTCHKKFGTSKTIVASNNILPIISEIILSENFFEIDATKKNQLLEAIMNCFGKNGISQGAMLKLILKKNNISYEDEITRIYRLNHISIYILGCDFIKILANIDDKETKKLKSVINQFSLLEALLIDANHKNYKKNIISRSSLISHQTITLTNKIEKSDKIISLINYIEYTIKNLLSVKNKPMIIKTEAKTNIL